MISHKRLLTSIGGAGSGVLSAVTWDPATKNANITLSGGNLVATSTAGGGTANLSARSTASFLQTDKKYGEFTNTLANTFGCVIGVANSTWPVSTTNTFVGSDTNSIGYDSNATVFYNNGSVATLATYGQGNTICVASSGGNIWWRINGGNWNNNASNDPVANIGGIAINITGSLFWALTTPWDGTSAQTWTGKFTTPFSFTVPTGFSGQPP